MSRSKFRSMNVDQKGMDLSRKMEEYVNENIDFLIKNFVNCFENYCKKIISMQQAGEKGAIGYIHFSILQTNILAGRHRIRLDAYDENWHMDRAECSDEYEVGAFYRWLDEFIEMLEEARKKSADKITPGDVQKVVLEESNKYQLVIAEFIRAGMRTAINTDAFRTMQRNELFVVCVGGYQDRIDIVYKEDDTIKDAGEIRRYLGAKEQQAYSYEICEKLDLTNGTYEDMEIMYSSFAESDFTGSSWKNSAILFCNFKEAVLKDVILERTQIFDTDFSDAVLENINFQGAKLKNLSFEGATLVNVKFEGALMVEELNFSHAELIDTVIPK